MPNPKGKKSISLTIDAANPITGKPFHAMLTQLIALFNEACEVPGFLDLVNDELIHAVSEVESVLNG